jgi:hypothetical protein
MDAIRNPRVFISYLKADADFARRLADQLRSLLPESEIFLDQEISPGSDWVSTIADIIPKSDAFIAVVSDNSDDYSWSIFEIGLAISAREKSGRPIIIPILRGSPSKMPDFLKSFQYIDFRVDSEFARNATMLAKALTEFEEKHPTKSLDKTNILESYFDIQRTQLQELKNQQIELERRYYRDGVRKAIAGLLLLIVVLVTFAVYLSVIDTRSLGGIKDWITIVIGPTIGLFGAVVGFYFGQRSVLDS